MSTPLPSQRVLPSTFLSSINALLAALALPFTIDHPTDLTPSLLLAVFESLIGARLPIPASVRQSRTRDAKARAMLVLLGVLECDVLRGGTSSDADASVAASNADESALGGAGGVSVDGWVDEIGLGDVDPEQLADGGWDETIFVGELLCWLARRRGVLPRTRSSHSSSHPHTLYSNHYSYGTEDAEGDITNFSTSLLLRPSSVQKSRPPRPPSPSPPVGDADADFDFSVLSHISDVPRHPLVHSPEPSLSASATTGTDLSIRARSVSSRTSVSNAHDDPDEFEEASQDTLQMYDPRQMMQDAEDDEDRPPTFHPRCIHELDDPSYIRVLAGPSLSFDPSASLERVSEDGEGHRSSGDDVDDDDADEQDNDDPYAPPTPTPRSVRLTGWIEPVDSAAELSRFVTSRSRSRTPNTTARSGPTQLESSSYRHTRTVELSKPTSRLQTDLTSLSRPGSSKLRVARRTSPSLSRSPSPSSPPISFKTGRPHSSPSPSPPPPSPPANPDPPFDVSFSTLNNTSTPAKPRPPRRHHSSTTARSEAASDTRVEMDRGNTGWAIAATMATGTGAGYARRRSPSYTPSPPSFSSSGGLRGGGEGGTRARDGPTARLSVKTPATQRRSLGNGETSSSPEPRSLGHANVPPGSTTMTTNTLLTERARLLTELAALKRARAASAAGSGLGTGVGPGTGTGTGGGHGTAGRRVGVGVRS